MQRWPNSYRKLAIPLTFLPLRCLPHLRWLLHTLLYQLLLIRMTPNLVANRNAQSTFLVPLLWQRAVFERFITVRTVCLWVNTIMDLTLNFTALFITDASKY